MHEEPLGEAWELTPAFVAAAERLKPRLIFLASPNNPTGNAMDPGLVDRLRALPGCTLVLDEAYAEFGGRSLLKAAPAEAGLVVLRTFSKAWGLAGLRLGWLCAEPGLVAELEKLRLPYNLNALTQALAEEALACHKAGIGFDVVPGVSAVSAVPAYAGIPLTSSSSPAVHVISAKDERRRGLSPWPWLIGSLFVGSISPLAYVVYRETVGRKQTTPAAVTTG